MTDVNSEFDKRWNQQYTKLVEFKRKNGHCIVPTQYAPDKFLGHWVQSQRGGKIRQDRKKLLEELEFVWKTKGVINNNTYDKKWTQQYENLAEFRRKNGHCLVPLPQDKDLGRWVATQRKRRKNNKIRQDRKDLLDEIDFVWRVDIADISEKNWYQTYKKLVEFKRKNGHCIVPQDNEKKDNKALAIWISKQRRYHNNNSMRQNRKELLVALDFVWEADTLAARHSSTADDVSGLTIGSFHAWVRFFFSLSFF
jgi:hypothetical protein